MNFTYDRGLDATDSKTGHSFSYVPANHEHFFYSFIAMWREADDPPASEIMRKILPPELAERLLEEAATNILANAKGKS